MSKKNQTVPIRKTEAKQRKILNPHDLKRVPSILFSLLNSVLLTGITDRGYLFSFRVWMIAIFILIGCLSGFDNAIAQSYSCDKDRLNENTIRFSSDPSGLSVGALCEVSVFNSKDKRISKGLSLSSDNKNVKINGLSFSVEYRANPWMHVDGSFIEVDGNIRIEAKNCNHSYQFPFSVRQSFTFDNNIICRGEKKEFAIARYKNNTGKELIAVMDLSYNQLYLLENPITIDASGISGKDGARGDNGRNGSDGTERSVNGDRGANGGSGGDGGDGGDGGNITMYLPYNVDGITVLVDGGYGGKGGRGGSGGRGGEGYKRKTGETSNFLGIKVPKYEK